MTRRPRYANWMLGGTLVLALGCEKPKHYTTTVELVQIQRFGQDPKAGPGMMDLELKSTSVARAAVA